MQKSLEMLFNECGVLGEEVAALRANFLTLLHHLKKAGLPADLLGP
jgi:hypothetical protein